MTKDELILIMGPPKSVIAPVDWKNGAQKEGQVFIYQAPPLASDNLTFYLDADSIVKSISYGD
ncbi:hypothetical protein [Pontibacter sp. H249]|uniref:hypothetical protein n=1 Tax=Pontibacter sp. H249 TaxID=3133420 RepID=UPI0030BB2A7B